MRRNLLRRVMGMARSAQQSLLLMQHATQRRMLGMRQSIWQDGPLTQQHMRAMRQANLCMQQEWQ
jgi:hypothetical protein